MENYEDPAWVRCTMLSAGWRTARELVTMTNDEVRNTLITELNQRCTDGVPALQGKSNQTLSEHAMIGMWLVDARVRTQAQLALMSLEDQRNTTIAELASKSSTPVSSLQAMHNFELLVAAHRWWLPRNFSTLKSRLSAIQNGAPQYRLQIWDEDRKQSVRMDCLKVMEVKEGTNPAAYYGVYHYDNPAGNDFELYLATSSDLTNWSKLRSLGDNNHMGVLCQALGGYLLVNEMSGDHSVNPPIPNKVRFRFFKTLEKLTTRDQAADLDFTAPANLSSTQAEGTPSIRQISGTSPDDSVIVIGQHYMTQDTDRLATGVLINFREYHNWRDVVANTAVDKLGYKGKVGARDTFLWNGQQVFIQEAQLVNGDFATWRLLLGNGRFYTSLPMNTGDPADTSFANPHVTALSSGQYAVTSFLFTEGNGDAHKGGELLYTISSSS